MKVCISDIASFEFAAVGLNLKIFFGLVKGRNGRS